MANVAAEVEACAVGAGTVLDGGGVGLKALEATFDELTLCK